MQFNIDKTGGTISARAKKTTTGGRIALFASEEEEEGEETRGATDLRKRRVGRLLEENVERRKRNRALEETDPSVFDFDAWKQTEEGRGQKDRRIGGKRKYGVVYDGGKRGGDAYAEKPKARYIEALLKKSRERQRVQEIVREKSRHRELQKELEELGETETFVTGAYKKKLIEDEKWIAKRREDDDAAKDREAREDVGGGMSGFYRNLLTKNVAFGGETATEKIVGFKDGPAERETFDDEDAWVRRESRSQPGQFYWKHRETGETSWKRPRGAGGGIGGDRVPSKTERVSELRGRKSATKQRPRRESSEATRHRERASAGQRMRSEDVPSSPPRRRPSTTTSTGRRWLADNAQKSGVVTLPSGLQYRVLATGGRDESGTPYSSKRPCACHYRGRLIDGTVFDESRAAAGGGGTTSVDLSTRSSDCRMDGGTLNDVRG
eukprot:g1620.t1